MSQNTFDRFTVLFTNGKIFLGENSFPLGQFTVDFLNLDERVLDKIEERVNSFLPTMQILLGEKTDNFLYTEFYRGLIAGNMPRKCHNCGRYFLLMEGYNTCYCNNIASGETERTCRKVGAHRKANHPTGLSPAQMEYRKVYNRLKARKQRGKISSDEWNSAVAQAQEVLMQAEQGKLNDEEMRKKFTLF